MNLFDQLANTNLAEVSTSYPVLTGGVYEFTIKTFEKKTSDRTGGVYLAIGTTLLSPDATDINGNSVSPGYAMRHMISLTPSAKQLENKTEEECNKDAITSLCKFLDALMTERVWDETLESYIGLTFFAKTKVGKERTDPNTGDVYAAQSEFAAFIPKQG